MMKPIVMEFLKFVIKELGIKTKFKVILSEDHSNFSTLAYYDKENPTVSIYTKNRAVADILRSIAHELTHHKQNEQRRLEINHPDVGGEIEDEANARAGSLIKKFGKEIRPDVYTL